MHQFVWAAASRAVAFPFAFRKVARFVVGTIAAALPLISVALVQAAHAGSIKFSGTVVNAASSSFEVNQTRVTAFGDEAGVRLNAFNSEPAATHLVASVFDQHSRPVPSALLGRGVIVPAGGASRHILVVKLNQSPHQTFKVCLTQHTAARVVSARECFLLEVNRI